MDLSGIRIGLNLRVNSGQVIVGHVTGWRARTFTVYGQIQRSNRFHQAAIRDGDPIAFCDVRRGVRLVKHVQTEKHRTCGRKKKCLFKKFAHRVSKNRLKRESHHKNNVMNTPFYSYFNFSKSTFCEDESLPRKGKKWKFSRRNSQEGFCLAGDKSTRDRQTDSTKVKTRLTRGNQTVVALRARRHQRAWLRSWKNRKRACSMLGKIGHHPLE